MLSHPADVAAFILEAVASLDANAKPKASAQSA